MMMSVVAQKGPEVGSILLPPPRVLRPQVRPKRSYSFSLCLMTSSECPRQPSSSYFFLCTHLQALLLFINFTERKKDMSSRGRSTSRTLALAGGAAVTRRMVGDLYTLAKRRVTKTKPKARSPITGLSKISLTKRYLRDQADELRGANQLHFTSVLEGLQQGTGINDRLRQQIYVKDVSVNLHFQASAGSNPFVPQITRWALVSAKGRRIPFTSNDMGEDLFLGHNTARYVNFSSIANAMHKHTYALNREQWDVHAEGRFTLKLPNNALNGSGEVYKVVQKTISVNKVVYFDAADASLPQNGIYFIFWFNQPFYNAIAADATTTQRATITFVSRFLEP